MVRRILLMVLVVVTALGPASHHVKASTQRNLCTALGGKCLRGRQRCREGQTSLPTLLCGQHGGQCCTPGAFGAFIEGFQKPIKRLPIPVRQVCPKTPGKCKKRGGRCLPLSRPCDTYANPKLCSGGPCTCCYGDHVKCTSTPACKGGFCFRGSKSVCQSGKILRSGCKGKKCSCCLPRSSQGSIGGSSARCACGKSNQERIVGGQVLNPPHEFPWLVGLVSKHRSKFYCGGTIISPWFVITAGHCLYNQRSGDVLKPSEIQVKVADFDQYSHVDDVKGVTRLVDVKEIIPYDRYIVFRVYHDIGLLHLKTELDLTSHLQVRAACLPLNPSRTYEGMVGTAYGWGILKEDDKNFPDIPRKVSMPILGPDCKGKQFGDVTITSYMMCAGGEGGKDTCQGDSGGPFTVEEDNHHTLVGITSFGTGCARPGSPGVYTRVTAYLPWILSKVKDPCINT